MKLECSICAKVSENIVRDRVIAYFTKADYTLGTSQSHLAYQRGSGLGSLVSFSPRGWKVNATIQITSSSDQLTQVAVTFDINTTGQWVTESERRFWQSEFDDLEKAIQTGDMDISASTRKAQSSLMQNLLACALIIGSTIVLAIVADLLFNSRTALNVGEAVGLALGFLISQRWLKFRIGGS